MSQIGSFAPATSSADGTRLCHRYSRLNSIAIQFVRYQRSVKSHGSAPNLK